MIQYKKESNNGMASEKAEKGIVKIRGFLFLCKNQVKSH